VFNVSTKGDEEDDYEYNRSRGELGIREVIEHSVELKLHFILLCGVFATARSGWVVKRTCKIHNPRANDGMLDRIARAHRANKVRFKGVTRLNEALWQFDGSYSIPRNTKLSVTFTGM
jgi:hypothetical protein